MRNVKVASAWLVWASLIGFVAVIVAVVALVATLVLVPVALYPFAEEAIKGIY